MNAQQPFFICGYPRSRTAWLANFLTWGDAFCYHDAFRHCERVADLRALFESTPARFVGNSDPANLLFQDQLIRLFPEARWVLIVREHREAEASALKALGLDSRRFDLFHHKLVELARKVDPLIVPFEELNGSAEEIAKFVCPTFSSPPERSAMLTSLNVQIDRGYFERAHSALLPQITALLRETELPRRAA